MTGERRCSSSRDLPAAAGTRGGDRGESGGRGAAGLVRAARCAGRAAAAAAARGELGRAAAGDCELRAERVAARGGFAKNSTSWGGKWRTEVGGEARPGAPARRRLGGAGWGKEEGPAARARAQELETRRAGQEARPEGITGAGTPGRAADARGRTRGRQEGSKGSAGWSGRELWAAPAFFSLAGEGPGSVRRLGVSEAKHAYARSGVLVRRRP